MVALVAAAVSVADYLAWRANYHGLASLAASSGLLDAMPDMSYRLPRETEPARAQTLVAWGLLDLEVDRSWLADLPAEERADQERLGLDRLRLARQLALEVLPRRPTSWQAHMVLGTTRYLEAERVGERSQPASFWRRPLVNAAQLAAGHPEPPLFLASASLSSWSSMSQAERDAALPVLTRAMSEPGGFDLLLRPWVRLAPSMETLLEVVPDRPDAWRRLGQLFRSAGDFERFCVAHDRWLESLPAFAAERAGQAELWERRGDPRSAHLARQVVTLPADLALASSFSRALAVLPEDAPDGMTRAHLRRWLLWALDLCVLGGCPFEAGQIDRLVRSAGDLHPAQVALATLAAGDPAAAGTLEAGAEADPEWRSYWVYKAHRLADDDPAAARGALARVAAGLPRDPLLGRAKQRLGEGRDDSQPIAASATRKDWSSRDGAYRLVLDSPERYQALRLGFEGVPSTGGAVEIRWDGRILGAGAVASGETLIWPLAVEPGLHQLEVASLSGAAVRPATLSLEVRPSS